MKREASFQEVLFCERRETGVVDGAEGLGAAARADRDGRIATGGFGGIEEAAEGGSVDAGHIAGQKEAPRREAGAEGGVEAAQGAEAGKTFLEAGIAEMSVEGGRRDKEGAAGGLGGDAGDTRGEWFSAEFEQRFIAAHAAAAAAGEDEGRASHERIVATAARAAAGLRTTQNGPCV